MQGPLKFGLSPPSSAFPASKFVHGLPRKNGPVLFLGLFDLTLFNSIFFWKSDSLATIREGHTVTSLHTFYRGALPQIISMQFTYWKWSENRVLRSTELIISKMLLTPILSICCAHQNGMSSQITHNPRAFDSSSSLSSPFQISPVTLTPEEATIWILMYSFSQSEHSKEP